MTALEDLTYSMEWFVSLAGDILFERSVEDASLTADHTKLVETNLKETPEGLIISMSPVYIQWYHATHQSRWDERL